MLCDIALHCAQIKEDGKRTDALIELTAMTEQLTSQVICKLWFWAAITYLIKRLLFSRMHARPLAAGLSHCRTKREVIAFVRLRACLCRWKECRSPRLSCKSELLS